MNYASPDLCKGLCTEDRRVQKGVADLLHSLAGLVRCVSTLLLVYTAIMAITAFGRMISSGGERARANSRPVPSSSHAYAAESSRREPEDEKKGP